MPVVVVTDYFGLSDMSENRERLSTSVENHDREYPDQQHAATAAAAAVATG
jgi:hypothetical protein